MMTEHLPSPGTEKPYCIVVVARHGERLDYVTRDSGGNWVESAERPWDPPLSTHGKEQGLKLGRHLVKELEDLGLPPISGIYSSPLLRCRETAAEARKGILQALEENGATPFKTPLPVRIETGLIESINTSWYRSWAMRGLSDGTWAQQIPANTLIDYHPRSIEPVQSILSEWRDSMGDGDDQTQFDLEYTSQTTIEEPYTFMDVESKESQRKRMRHAVTLISQQQQQGGTNTGQPAKENQTVLFFSHGAPVTYLFEELTGRDRSEFGRSSYCCYSIYKIDLDQLKTHQDSVWEAVRVNQAEYLEEAIISEDHLGVTSH